MIDRMHRVEELRLLTRAAFMDQDADATWRFIKESDCIQVFGNARFTEQGKLVMSRLYPELDGLQ